MKVTYRTLYQNVPQLEIFSKEKTPWEIGLCLGTNLLKLRDQWQLVEETRASIARDFIELDKEGEDVIRDQKGFSETYTNFFAKEFEYEPSTLAKGEFAKMKDISGTAWAALLALGITEE